MSKKKKSCSEFCEVTDYLIDGSYCRNSMRAIPIKWFINFGKPIKKYLKHLLRDI